MLLVLLIQTTSQILLRLLPALFLSLAELSSARSPAPQYSWGSVFSTEPTSTCECSITIWSVWCFAPVLVPVRADHYYVELEPRTLNVVGVTFCSSAYELQSPRAADILDLLSHYVFQSFQRSNWIVPPIVTPCLILFYSKCSCSPEHGRICVYPFSVYFVS
jgi:hypothetical protein